MELDREITQKITERFLKRIYEQLPQWMDDMCMELLDGRHTVRITTRGKFTIAEIMYPKNGYTHHFLGVSAKNPNDVEDKNHGIKVATEKAICELLDKFYNDEI